MARLDGPFPDLRGGPCHNTSTRDIVNVRIREEWRTIGKDAGLSGHRLARFVTYVETRFAGATDAYIAEWAERFAKGHEWEYSDGAGRKLLKSLWPDLY